MPSDERSLIFWMITPRCGNSDVKQPSRYTCKMYREEMILAGLRARLAREQLSETQQAEIRAEIKRLEAEMDMD